MWPSTSPTALNVELKVRREPTCSLNVFIECLLSLWAPPPCDERRSLHDPSDRSPHLRSQRRPQARVHGSLTQAQSALFEVVHKSLHAVKPGRELGQVVFQRVELPVEVPHGVRQGPDPARFHREKTTVTVKASWKLLNVMWKNVGRNLV